MNGRNAPANKARGDARKWRERRKLLALGLLVVVGLAVWGRMLFNVAPRSASGQTPPAQVRPSDAAVESPDRPVVHVDLRPAVERDLFALDPAAYRRSAPPPGVENPGAGAKSAPDPSDALERRRHAVRAEADRLRLQGTLQGPAPQAMINGRLLGPGQSIDGFELIEIGSRRATLEKQGVRVDLEMSNR